VFDADDVYRTPLAMCAEIATMLRARAA
jgi:hypothetical protein